jgi:arginyl-tRNA synthetase
LDVKNYLIEPEFRFGALSTQIPIMLASNLKQSPRQIAKDLLDIILPLKKKYISQVKIAGPGYLNFYINWDIFAPTLLRKKPYKPLKKRPKVLLEHTSANPDGPLHLGHGRNAILGNVLANILKKIGHDVTVEYYVNDCGKQMAYAVYGFEKYGPPTHKPDKFIEEVYRKALKDAKEDQISNLLKKLEQGDKDTRHLFRKVVDLCLDGHKKTLKRLGISHDIFVYESSFLDKINPFLNKVSKSKHVIQDGLMLAVDLKKYGIEKEFLLRRSDGTSLYGSKDLLHHAKKLKYPFIIDVLGADHKLYFQSIKHTLKELGYLKKQRLEGVFYEFVVLPGTQMSTRKGTAIHLDMLIDQAIKKAYEEVKKRRTDLPEKTLNKIATKVGIGSIIYTFARYKPSKKITFDWKEALNFEKNSVASLLYAYTRASSILKKSSKKPKPLKTPLQKPEQNLLLLLAKYPTILESAGNDVAPHRLVAYAEQIVTAFKEFYTYCKVINTKEEQNRLAIVKLTKQTLGEILDLLGIAKLEEM